MKNSSLSNWLYLSLLVVFWGSTFALTKYALVDFSPLWIVALISAAAATAAACAAVRRCCLAVAAVFA